MGKRLSCPIAAYLRYIEGIKRDRQLGSGLRGRSLNLKKQVQKVVFAQQISGNLTNCETITKKLSKLKP
ncbi:MAG: hypothetical protein EAZ78_11755 [Oscillatoriales cyanobacterium]|uniref:Transposase n=1 Tax=Microcoleus anatoxicus PTRS2 TaxID=2705321 RepID=A0ABU8YIT8_9CYAN|nr:MAG: hypothetical protein EA000_13330 [Oscillatoriales cyanobacterium]TAD97550.1 MAG: hypothetical protein EAZ98_09295 [Oscillatoriales cyanobacterium]TAF03605.1 MAG: hypothetical protein EAZ78_11755 [Oscillatoriales cyanobacterium]